MSLQPITSALQKTCTIVNDWNTPENRKTAAKITSIAGSLLIAAAVYSLLNRGSSKTAPSTVAGAVNPITKDLSQNLSPSVQTASPSPQTRNVGNNGGQISVSRELEDQATRNLLSAEKEDRLAAEKEDRLADVNLLIQNARNIQKNEQKQNSQQASRSSSPVQIAPLPSAAPVDSNAHLSPNNISQNAKNATPVQSPLSPNANANEETRAASQNPLPQDGASSNNSPVTGIDNADEQAQPTFSLDANHQIQNAKDATRVQNSLSLNASANEGTRTPSQNQPPQDAASSNNSPVTGIGNADEQAQPTFSLGNPAVANLDDDQNQNSPRPQPIANESEISAGNAAVAAPQPKKSGRNMG